MHLRRYTAAAEELSRLSALGGGPLPFETAVLSAELPFLLSEADAVTALSQLLELARRTRGAAPGALGGAGPGGRATVGERLHLLQVLSHVALAAGHGPAAAEEIRAALREEEGSREPPGSSEVPARARLLSALGRHHADEGDVRAAELAFEKARAAGLPQDSAAALLDQGILCTARCDYANARAHFEQASAAALAGAGPRGLAELPPAAADEAVAAENNLAVCRLYTKELREGVQGLEAFVRKSPVLFLRGCVVQNLSALYEFMTDGGQRRVTLKEVVAPAFRDWQKERGCFA